MRRGCGIVDVYDECCMCALACVCALLQIRIKKSIYKVIIKFELKNSPRAFFLFFDFYLFFVALAFFDFLVYTVMMSPFSSSIPTSSDEIAS